MNKVGHTDYALKVYSRLPDEVKAQLTDVRSLILGTCVPDLAKTKENKKKTHFEKDHPNPAYAKDYKIPNMETVKALFLKKDPVRLGVFLHLLSDVYFIDNFLLYYARPLGNDTYENRATGDTYTGDELWGNKEKNIPAQLYQLYDKCNGEMAKSAVPNINEIFKTNFSADKEGFLDFMRWLFPDKMPLSGIPEMDDYRTTDDIHSLLEGYFKNDGAICTISIRPENLMESVEEGVNEAVRLITELYAS